MKKKFIVIVAIIVIIVFITSFLLMNRINPIENTKKSTQITTEHYSSINNEQSLTEYVSDLDSSENTFFEKYNSIFDSTGTNVIKELNENCIDEYYSGKLEKAKSPDEEIKILNSWNESYKAEITRASKVLNNLISKTKNNGEITNSEMINYIEEYSSAAEKYALSSAELAYNFEEYTLGHGTGHKYDYIINELSINRKTALTLIECIYVLGEDYDWAEITN